MPVHGDQFFSVIERAGLPWKWNARTLKTLALLGHAAGGETLHPSVAKVPSDSVVLLRRGGAEVRSFGFWEQAPLREESSREAIEIFNAVTAEFLGDRPVVSLSGCFDSRAILASVLRHGGAPVILTMGPANGTDRALATAIAKDLRLELRTVELQAEQYLENARMIVDLTGGTKTAQHWHTFLYSYTLRDEFFHQPHLVGSNGEFARSYYLDKGALSRAVDRFGAAAVAGFFLAKLERRRRRYPPELQFVHGSEGGSIVELAKRLTGLSGTSRLALDRLDRFYATERVPNFVGNGLNLYGASALPVG